MPGSRGLIHALEQRTAPNRGKGAESMFLTGRVALADRLLSGIYFHLSAHHWARKAHDPAHLAPLHAALEHTRPPRRVLDIGTGGGGSADLVASLHPQAEVVGIDISRRMLAHARRRFRRPNLTFRLASAARLPYPDDWFDLVICVNAVPQPAELRRVCTADAEILCVFSFGPAASAGSAWETRWRELGFRRIADGREGDGGFEVLRREARSAAPTA